VIDEIALSRRYGKNASAPRRSMSSKRNPSAFQSAVEAGKCDSDAAHRRISDLFLDSFWRYSVETLIALAQGYWPRSVVNPEVIPK